MFAATLVQHTAQAAQDTHRAGATSTVLNQAIASQPWLDRFALAQGGSQPELVKQWQYAIDEYNLSAKRAPQRGSHVLSRHANTHLRRLTWHGTSQRFARYYPRHFEGLPGCHSAAYRKRQDALDQLNQTIQLYPDSAVACAARATVERDMKQDEGRFSRLAEG